MKRIHVIGGGTFSPVRTHLALAAPAFGTLAHTLTHYLGEHVADSGLDEVKVHLHLTKMAKRPPSEAAWKYSDNIIVEDNDPNTNQDVLDLVDRLAADPETAIIFMTAAICDFEGQVGEVPSGKGALRLETRDGIQQMTLTPAEKVITRIRSKYALRPRKDIFLVGCKTTDGVSDDEMFLRGLRMLKETSCNLVLVNDVARRRNMIVTPEQARYSVTDDRDDAIYELMDMAMSRSQGTFTRSTVIPGTPVAWESPEVPSALRAVVDHCIKQGAYKDLLGNHRTVGHFAVKAGEGEFLTSQRNSDFNQLSSTGLVRVEADGDDRVVAHGAKPSVGGQSQRIIFQEHPEADCIVHFHCPLKGTADSPKMPQGAYECGSHQCGENTSRGLKEVLPGIKVVYLSNHGPNIVFNRDIDPQRVIEYIDQTFDLSRHTGEGLEDA